MTATRGAALMVLAVLVPGCSAGTPEAAAPEVLTGTILLTGSAPAMMVTLSRDGERDVTILGALRDEIQHLAGAVVSVGGRPAPGAPNSGFIVDSYRVDSIEGRRPVVGILEQRDGQYLVVGDETVPLAVLPTGLRDRTGAKVWVVGPLVDGALQAQSYGILRDP